MQQALPLTVRSLFDAFLRQAELTCWKVLGLSQGGDKELLSRMFYQAQMERDGTRETFRLVPQDHSKLNFDEKR